MPETITVAFEMGDEGNRATLSVRDGPVTTICQFSSEYARILADRLIRVADFMDGAEEAAEKDESNEPPAGASGESAPRESGPVPRPPGL